MKKVFIASLLVGLTSVANAVEYDVKINLAVEEEELTLTREVPMTFPNLKISRATDVNAACSSMPNQGNVNAETSMCFGATDGREARFKLQGVPNANITWSATSQPQTVDGISFHLYVDSFYRAKNKLDSAGGLVVLFRGIVKLEDKEIALQKPGEKTFKYDIVAAYQ